MVEESTISNMDRAEVLAQALPFIRKYTGKVVVVKYGGNAMVDETLKSQVMTDIVLLQLVGIRVVLVHGGGPEINTMLNRLGIESSWVDGLRVTSKEAMDVVQMTLAGKVNKTLVNLVQARGGSAMGISGMDGRLIQAEPQDERLGYVGKVTGVNVQPIIDLLDHGYLPIVSSLGCDDEGTVYNINADTAAAYIAGALHAERLIMMTDTNGLLQDVNDPSTLIHRITVGEARAMVRSDSVSGGMIPKLNCCISAIESGVGNVVILDGRVPHAVLMELLTPEGAGTMVLGRALTVPLGNAVE